MRFKFFPILLLVPLLFLLCSKSTDPIHESKWDHFEFILYDGLTVTDITEIYKQLENNHGRIIDDLQVESMPKVTAKIWSDYNKFMEAMEFDIGIRYTGATGYIFGMTEFRIYYTKQAQVTTVHEFVHLVTMNLC